MIEVSVGLSADNLVRDLNCSGHAGFAIKGTDIVCASFTLMLRTFVRTCESYPETVFKVVSDAEGDFKLQFDEVPRTEFFRGVCWYFLRGLDDLSRDFPGQVNISYQET
jgi:hypothetical protein